jgi:hypothetical protein
MTLEIFVEQLQITLKLIKNGQTIDSETFSYYHDLSDLLISRLDSLLKKNNIDTIALKSFKITGNVGEDSTSYKIVAAFVEALKVRV